MNRDMLRWTVAILMLVAAVPLSGVLRGADPAAPAPAPQPAVAPTTQPDAPEAAVPASQPDGPIASPVAQPAPPAEMPERPSQITFLLTRNLPEHLLRRNRVMWAQATEAERTDYRRIWSVLQNARAELEQIIQHKKQFDQFAPAVQQRYREKGELIEQVLDRLSPTEQAQLLNMSTEARAKRMLELIAELKAEQNRAAPAPARKPNP